MSNQGETEDDDVIVPPLGHQPISSQGVMAIKTAASQVKGRIILQKITQNATGHHLFRDSVTYFLSTVRSNELILSPDWFSKVTYTNCCGVLFLVSSFTADM